MLRAGRGFCSRHDRCAGFLYWYSARACFDQKAWLCEDVLAYSHCTDALSLFLYAHVATSSGGQPFLALHGHFLCPVLFWLWAKCMSFLCHFHLRTTLSQHDQLPVCPLGE